MNNSHLHSSQVERSLRRYAAHFVYCSPQRIIRNGVVEVENGRIVRFFSLNDYPEEVHSTEFFNGIILSDLFGGKLEDYTEKAIFGTLDNLYLVSENRLEENQTACLFLLQNCRFDTMTICKEAVLRRLC